MHIVENRTIYTGAALSFDPSADAEKITFLKDKYKSYSIECNSYWHYRFDKDEMNICFILTDRDIIAGIFGAKCGIEKDIIQLSIKIHNNGIASVETVFNYVYRKNSQKFDSYLDSFSNEHMETIFDLVFDICLSMQSVEMLSFSGDYKFGTTSKLRRNRRIADFFKKKETPLIKNKQMLDSYLLRVHLFCSTKKEYTEIQKSYKNDGMQFNESVIETPDGRFPNTLFWSFVLWLGNPKYNVSAISRLMDIDTYTMNEAIIYNTAANVYTDMLYSIDLAGNKTLRSKDLFMMHITNCYFLQKSKLIELSFNENVNSFVTKQRQIEKFDLQEKNYRQAEKNFLDMYNAVETNEKSGANRIIQYILTALTLLTIVSVSKDIIEFIRAEFSNDHSSLVFQHITRGELLSVLLLLIVLLFISLRKHINKI